uniref:Ig-like domain-containing protein n=1 Tax=Cyclopterus lumpus TaxID=8103 RepID=A0A8C2Z534_CYCLU
FIYIITLFKNRDNQDGWGVTYTPPELCAVRGSAVELLCTYTHPSRIQPRDISNTLWFTEEEHGDPVDLEQDSEYAGRVEYRCSEKRCSLRIKNLRESDSAEYKFMFMTNQPDEKYTGSPGVTLSVTDAPRLPSVSVSPSEIVEGSSVTLTCSSDANPAANYTWYKKNQPRPHGEEPQLVFSSIQSSDSGHLLNITNILNLPSVSVSPSEIVEGSSVTLTCSSDANPAANYTWYKKNQPRPHGEEPQLVFSSIQSSDSGQYLCEAENHLGKKRSELISIDVKLMLTQQLATPGTRRTKQVLMEKNLSLSSAPSSPLTLDSIYVKLRTIWGRRDLNSSLLM